MSSDNQPKGDPILNNQWEFDDFLYRRGNMYRTASGYPAENYFQNAAEYNIKAELNDQTHTISGHIDIVYTNNSPHKLDYLWLNVQQNSLRPDSRATLTIPMDGSRFDSNLTNGLEVSHVKAEVKTGGKNTDRFSVNDTRMKVLMPAPINARGGKATVKMDFQFKIPEKGKDRMGRVNTEKGVIYAIAQWFPKVAVYDDVVGWNIEPYLGAGEFYYDYGNFDVSITVPSGYVVVGSGTLKNPEKVLSKEAYNRFLKAQRSDETKYIVSPEEVGGTTYTKSSGKQTWHFSIKNSRDFAFATSKAFIWDGARINLPNGKTSFAQSVYPVESNTGNGWKRSTEYVKASIEHYSKKWFPYPYPSAINVAAEINGMEYPGVSFCHWKSKSSDLWGVTDHEFGHNWFPMIVGSNERRYPWMDEGFNTFINFYSTKNFNKGEYKTHLDKPGVINRWLKNPIRESISTYPDIVQNHNLGVTAYYKPALGLRILREYILGAERFDEAFRSYIKTWAFKHPQPTDFFNHIESVAGENLNWFWRGWFYSNDNIDMEVGDVLKTNKGYIITVNKLTEIPMPVKLQVEFADKSIQNLYLPVEVWQRGDTWKFLFKTEKTVRAVTIDPERILPDISMENNQKTLD
ncbi:peptidase family M1 [Elysia marginata]|uniref:Peptidase family M1 n=1 Tax=Elysia marginata TaxID=1093978 RepID=A0AAV4F0V5_9GAST|nr:peptidase family M1 [Elysia marginata]